MTEELKQLREALRRVKHEAASLADAQVIALEALTQRPAAQADDHSEQLTKAKRLLVDLHKIGGEDVRTLIEARTGPWFVWGQDRASLPTQPAAQATPEPSRHPLFAASVAARKWAELQEKGHRMQSLQFDGGPGGAGSIDPWGKVMWATPEPVGEAPIWNSIQIASWIGSQLMHEPAMFERAVVCKFVRSLGRHATLLKHSPKDHAPAPGVADFANLLKVKEVDWAEDIDHATKLEARAKGWNECREEVLRLLAAAQAKGQ